MEHGFYHKERGYWQTLVTPSQEEIDGYPDGTIEVPLKPSADHIWQNGSWVYIEPPVPTPEDQRALMPPLEKWRFDTIIDSRSGLREKIETAIDRNIPDLLQRATVRNKFRSVTQFSRLDPMFPFLASDPDININDQEIDEMWQQGLALT